MWPNPEETADLITFTEEILNGKLNFLSSDFDLGKQKHAINTWKSFDPIIRCTLINISTGVFIWLLQFRLCNTLSYIYIFIYLQFTYSWLEHSYA